VVLQQWQKHCWKQPLSELLKYSVIQKKMDSVSYVYISWTVHGMWMICIAFERGGTRFRTSIFPEPAWYVNDLHSIWKRRDSVSYVYISWNIRGTWMIYITFERGGTRFRTSVFPELYLHSIWKRGPTFSNTTARALAYRTAVQQRYLGQNGCCAAQDFCAQKLLLLLKWTPRYQELWEEPK
jgi:hypothetical protein